MCKNILLKYQLSISSWAQTWGQCDSVRRNQNPPSSSSTAQTSLSALFDLWSKNDTLWVHGESCARIIAEYKSNFSSKVRVVVSEDRTPCLTSKTKQEGDDNKLQMSLFSSISTLCSQGSLNDPSPEILWMCNHYPMCVCVCVYRNWCAFLQKRVVTNAVKCGTEKYTIRSQSPCPSGTADCQLVM